MAFTRVCSLDDIWQGDMAAYEVDGQPIVLVYPIDGEVIAIQGLCPHQQFSLAEGDFDGYTILICSAHVWQFDVTTGSGDQSTKAVNWPAIPSKSSMTTSMWTLLA